MRSRCISILWRFTEKSDFWWGSRKTNKYWGIALKGGLGQFSDLVGRGGGLGKKEGVVFLRGRGVNTPIYTMLTLDLALKFYISVAKGFKLKVRKFLGLIPTFLEVTGEKLVELPVPPILNRAKAESVVRILQNSQGNNCAAPVFSC